MLKHAALSSVVAQTHEMLSSRVKEIRGMCNIRCEAISILPSLTESQRQLVKVRRVI